MQAVYVLLSPGGQVFGVFEERDNAVEAQVFHAVKNKIRCSIDMQHVVKAHEVGESFGVSIT